MEKGINDKRLLEMLQKGVGKICCVIPVVAAQRRSKRKVERSRGSELRSLNDAFASGGAGSFPHFPIGRKALPRDFLLARLC